MVKEFGLHYVYACYPGLFLPLWPISVPGTAPGRPEPVFSGRNYVGLAEADAEARGEQALAPGRCSWKSLGESAGAVWAGICKSNPEPTLFFFFFLALCSVDVQFGNWELGWCSSGSSGAEHGLHSHRLGGTEQCVNPLSGGTCVGVCSHPWTRSCGHRKRVVIPLLLMQ